MLHCLVVAIFLPHIPLSRYQGVTVSEYGAAAGCSFVPLFLRWIQNFIRLGQLPALLPHIPTSTPELKTSTYDVSIPDLLVLWSAASFSCACNGSGCIATHIL